MKIEFTRHCDLDALSRIVKPGDILESPRDGSEDLLQAYVANGIAINLMRDEQKPMRDEKSSSLPSSLNGSNSSDSKED